METQQITDKEQAAEVFRNLFESARLSEGLYANDPLRLNIPLTQVSRAEGRFRGLLLDYEALAREAHQFFMGYANRHPEILTEQARETLQWVDYLNNGGKGRFHLVELGVPKKLGGIGEHRVEIDVVSFYDIKNTMNLLGQYVSPNNILSFHRPIRKGPLGSEYWSTRSVNRVQKTNKVEETNVKVRKRIHGTGYSLTEEMVRNLKTNSKWTDTMLGIYAK